MPKNPDWYPSSQEALPAWWANFFGNLTVAPKTPGESEQIEMRSRYIDGNESIGQYSDIKQAFIAP